VVVSDVDRSTQPVDELAPARLPGRTMVTLTSVSDDDLGEELRLVWEVEPGRDIVPAPAAPREPGRLGRPRSDSARSWTRCAGGPSRAPTPAFPWIVPTFRGGLQCEWHADGIDLEIDIDPNGSVDVLFMDSIEQKEWDGSLTERQGGGSLVPRSVGRGRTWIDRTVIRGER
jgi:hypothetical protein